MLAFFCLGARYRPWRYSAAVRSRVFGDGAAPRRTRCSPQPRQHSVIADSASCGDSIHVATAPLIRQAELAQREGYLPYLWRLSSVLLADAIGL